MRLSEVYEKGVEIPESKGLSFMLRGVETEYVLRNNEGIFGKYRFHQKAIDAG